MSPGGTMIRVYAELKARILAGAFSPGERLDPARLSGDLAASVTPIRDALHRLTGERLVDSWQHEGFRQPLVSEAGLRDLYGWGAELLVLTTRAAAQSEAPVPWPRPELGDDYADNAASVFAWIADHSPNHEHRAQVASLNDRLHVVRLVEARLLHDCEVELDALVGHIATARWSEARQALEAYHRRRLRCVPQITAQIRPRDAQ